MNWLQALKDLGDGHDVYRDSWQYVDEFVTPEFAARAQYLANPEAWPYVNDMGWSFRLKYGSGGRVYEPTEEDKKATDWQLG